MDIDPHIDPALQRITSGSHVEALMATTAFTRIGDAITVPTRVDTSKLGSNGDSRPPDASTGLTDVDANASIGSDVDLYPPDAIDANANGDARPPGALDVTASTLGSNIDARRPADPPCDAQGHPTVSREEYITQL